MTTKTAGTENGRDPMQIAGQALIEALDRYGFPMSRGAWEFASTHASVEAKALHEAAVQFRAALDAAATTPRPRKITGRAALRVDDVTRPE